MDADLDGRQTADQPQQFGGPVRLAQKQARLGQFTWTGPDRAGRHKDFDLWPAFMNQSGKAQSIWPAGHIDVGEQNSDFARVLELLQSFSRISRFNDPESGVLKNIAADHTNERLVFDDQYCGARLNFHMDLTPGRRGCSARGRSFSFIRKHFLLAVSNRRAAV